MGIRESMRHFDMHADDGALVAIDNMMGEGAPPVSEDDYNGDTPLANALALLSFRESPAWADILNGVENIKTDLKKKSEDMSLGRDARLSSLDQLQGIATVMAFIGGAFISAQERANRLNTDEKLLVGKETLRQVSSKPAEVVKPQQIADNTAKAISFLEGKSS